MSDKTASLLDELNKERDAVNTRRAQLPEEYQAQSATIGLALSGGGIRSATFCLGVVRALAKNKLLIHFDYLSTVSGGGYLGGMLGRLYQKNKDPVAVQDALARDDTILLAWLRNNGRYLIPAGMRDTSLGIAQILRSFVAALFLVTLLCIAIAGIAISVNLALQGPLDLRLALLPAAKQQWLMTLAVPLAFSAWMAITYWLTLSKWPFLLNLTVGFILTVVAAAGIYFMMCQYAEQTDFNDSLFVTGALGLINIIAIALAIGCPGKNVAQFRQRLTLALTRSLTLALAVLLLWLIYCGGWALYLRFHSSLLIVPPTVVAGVKIIWELRPLKLLATSLANKSPVVSVSLLQLANILGFVIMIFSLLTVCAAEIDFLLCKAHILNISQTMLAWLPAMLTLGIAGLFALFCYGKILIPFLNLSSLHNLYRSRLERAWLSVANYGGGKNKRFADNPLDSKPSGKLNDIHRVTDHLPGDDIHFNKYAPHRQGGPIHLITCCINQTVDDRTGNYNADRKGIALTLSALGVETGTRLPGPVVNMKDATLSHWIAISGAAAATGMGSRTAPGLAFLLFVIGGRLGYWSKNLCPVKETATKKKPTPFAVPALFAEMFARFPGRNSKYWFLSDGGHFENTGVYPLLKRNLKTIVVADCGADPKRQFDDLENLVRKARIDYGIDIVFHAAHSPHFTSLAQLQKGGELPPLLRAKIIYPDCNGQPVLPGTLIIVKPHSLKGMGLDTLSYAGRHSDFPHQTTGDQFFDEAQWEAYHQLGFQAGSAINREMLL
ncbi:TPA: patatin-like phospholipase family protein [Citrobacter amalonaticus]